MCAPGWRGGSGKRAPGPHFRGGGRGVTGRASPGIARPGALCYAGQVSAGDFDLIFGALQGGGVRYLVVGGVAVALHGHPRFTADLDLVVALDPENARKALAALAGLGYRPRAPVDGALFADPEVRQRWIDEKGLVVFTLWSPEHLATEVDLFVREPFPFDAAWDRATFANLLGVRVPVASIADLVALKRVAGRPKDLEDIRVLEAIAREGKHG
jgi:hypothetical protein